MAKIKKLETGKEDPEHPDRFPTIDPVKGRIKIRIDHKTELYVRPHKLEYIKQKYNLI